MKTHSLRIATLGLAMGASALSTVPAQAHINMEGALSDRGGDMKTGPCGGAKWGGGTVYTFAPGATITLGVKETIAHDGYFRISFDNAGEDFDDPASIDPINPNRYGAGKKCSDDAADSCGKSDFCNMSSDGDGPTVLWDNLDPHIPPSPISGASWSWNVKLPEVECDKCTIQVMQVMEDPAGGAHGPFDGKADLYFRCVDIKLVKGAKDGPGISKEPVSNKGLQCKAGDTPVEPPPDADVDGGVSEPVDSTPPARDAAVNAEDSDAPSEEEESAPTGTTKDAGKPTVKKDAGVSSDDGEAGSDGDEGCTVALGGSRGASTGWSLLALAAGLLVRRRKLAGRRAA